MEENTHKRFVQPKDILNVPLSFTERSLFGIEPLGDPTEYLGSGSDVYLPSGKPKPKDEFELLSEYEQSEIRKQVAQKLEENLKNIKEENRINFF